MVASHGPAESTTVALLNVRSVAAMLDCSVRHVYRLSGAGRMPKPVRIGALVRWPHQAVLDWIAAGCKPVQEGKR